MTHAPDAHAPDACAFHPLGLHAFPPTSPTSCHPFHRRFPPGKGGDIYDQLQAATAMATAVASQVRLHMSQNPRHDGSTYSIVAGYAMSFNMIADASIDTWHGRHTQLQVPSSDGAKAPVSSVHEVVEPEAEQWQSQHVSGLRRSNSQVCTDSQFGSSLHSTHTSLFCLDHIIPALYACPRYDSFESHLSALYACPWYYPMPCALDVRHVES